VRCKYDYGWKVGSYFEGCYGLTKSTIPGQRDQGKPETV